MSSFQSLRIQKSRAGSPSRLRHPATPNPCRQHRVAGSHDRHVRPQVDLHDSGDDDNEFDPFVGNPRSAGLAGRELDQVGPKPDCQDCRAVSHGRTGPSLFPSSQHVVGVRLVAKEIVDRELQPFGEGRDGIER